MTWCEGAARVAVVDTGLANTASVVAALSRATGVLPELTRDPGVVRGAAALVLPGVGTFGAGMEVLERSRLVGVLRDRIGSGRPTLAICLGMQLLAEGSEESPGVRGLGVLPVGVRRFPEGVRTPQFGWNAVDPTPGCALVRPGSGYFANSYRLTDSPAGWSVSIGVHGGRFAASLERGAVLACQFHPELSGAWGAALIEGWLDRAGVLVKTEDASCFLPR